MNWLFLVALALTAVVVNIPLGQLRQGYPRFSYGWCFYALIAVAAVIYLRIKTGYSWKILPLILCCAAAGQWLGSTRRQRLA
jgi:uncharacterized membrane protein YjdF